MYVPKNRSTGFASTDNTAFLPDKRPDISPHYIFDLSQPQALTRRRSHFNVYKARMSRAIDEDRGASTAVSFQWSVFSWGASAPRCFELGPLKRDADYADKR